MDRDIVMMLVVTVTLIFITITGLIWLDSISCRASAEGMKTVVNYSVFGGCRIGTADGRMVPLSVYREIRPQRMPADEQTNVK